MYALQGRDGLYDMMRPYVIIINLTTLAWFCALQYYRFKSTGRACSGDFLGEPLPLNYNTVYLNELGQWHIYYIGAQYFIYVLCKIAAIIVTNKLESEFEENKAKLTVY